MKPPLNLPPRPRGPGAMGTAASNQLFPTKIRTQRTKKERKKNTPAVATGLRERRHHHRAAKSTFIKESDAANKATAIYLGVLYGGDPFYLSTLSDKRR
ncbi:hypothetical protein GWI33_019460 [Rhynchophorus ferrugineus]|uniref:Uncharacterized protein n=1 Tax=Rhynchophorus ferrugineus TaxID=354439 RepID=A0A834M6Z9_RHYFE|nr:hypothetical protein GWI33_019460 [Rhynchophorus ferrugineus]